MPRAAELAGKRYGRLIVRQLLETVHGRRRWLCECDCGNTTVATTNTLNMGHVKSCGCLFVDSYTASGKKLAAFNGKPHGHAAFHHVKNAYTQSAKLRGLSFELTDEDFRKLTSGFCFYCGSSPSRIIKPTRKAQSGNYVCNGIDRLDSSAGYTVENCVPCCTVCNYAKRNVSLEEFIAWIDRLIEFRKNKSIEESILSIIRDRLEHSQAGPYACEENSYALLDIRSAMDFLRSRTENRLKRGVEGTSTP
jgi:hypothetical protein